MSDASRRVQNPSFALLCLVIMVGGCGRKEGGPAPPGPSGQAVDAQPGKAPVPTSAPRPLAIVKVLGQDVQVEYPDLDLGDINAAFDGDKENFARTRSATTAVFLLDFPKPVHPRELYVKTAMMNVGITARFYPEGTTEPKNYYAEMKDNKVEPMVKLSFDAGDPPAKRIAIEVKNLDGGDGHIHVRDIEFR